MNIAVSPEAIKQHEAHKAVRARLRANPWKPKLIEAAPEPEIEIEEKPEPIILKVVKQIRPVIRENQNSHVKMFRHYRYVVDVVNKGEPHEIAKYFAISNSWHVGRLKVPGFKFTFDDIVTMRIELFSVYYSIV